MQVRGSRTAGWRNILFVGVVMAVADIPGIMFVLGAYDSRSAWK